MVGGMRILMKCHLMNTRNSLIIKLTDPIATCTKFNPVK